MDLTEEQMKMLLQLHNGILTMGEVSNGLGVSPQMAMDIYTANIDAIVKEFRGKVQLVFGDVEAPEEEPRTLDAPEPEDDADETEDDPPEQDDDEHDDEEDPETPAVDVPDELMDAKKPIVIEQNEFALMLAGAITDGEVPIMEDAPEHLPPIALATKDVILDIDDVEFFYVKPQFSKTDNIISAKVKEF